MARPERQITFQTFLVHFLFLPVSWSAQFLIENPGKSLAGYQPNEVIPATKSSGRPYVMNTESQTQTQPYLAVTIEDTKDVPFIESSSQFISAPPTNKKTPIPTQGC